MHEFDIISERMIVYGPDDKKGGAGSGEKAEKQTVHYTGNNQENPIVKAVKGGTEAAQEAGYTSYSVEHDGIGGAVVITEDD